MDEGSGEPSELPVTASVLVPVYNEERHIRGTIAGLLAQRFDEPHEFLLIDGRSTDATRAIIEELAGSDPRLRVIDNPERKIPQALNAGLAAARGEFIVRMDAHAHYPPHYIARCVERLRRGGVASVSGPQIAVGNSPGSRRVALALGTWLGTGGAEFREAGGAEREVNRGFTGAWRRATLQRLGGWNTEIPFDEDGELAARLTAAEGPIVCLPELAADYIPRDNLKALARQYYRYGGSRVLTTHLHPTSIGPAQLLPPALVLAVPAALLGGPTGKVARGLLGTYALAVLVTSARAARSASPGDAVRLPAVFAAMHFGWGAGFVTSSVRTGPPLRGCAHALRRGLGLVGRAARRRR